MNYHKKPETPEEVKAWDAMLYKQLRQVDDIDNEISCICERRFPVNIMFRCYYCGLWLCPKCAKEHFGERPAGERTRKARNEL